MRTPEEIIRNAAEIARLGNEEYYSENGGNAHLRSPLPEAGDVAGNAAYVREHYDTAVYMLGYPGDEMVSDIEESLKTLGYQPIRWYEYKG